MTVSSRAAGSLTATPEQPPNSTDQTNAGEPSVGEGKKREELASAFHTNIAYI